MKGRARGADVVGLLEATYALDQSTEGWLRGIVSAAAIWDCGAGMAAVLYDISDGQNARVDGIEAVGAAADWVDAGFEMHKSPVYRADMVRGYRNLGCALAREYIPAGPVFEQVRREFLSPRGLEDMTAVNGPNPAGMGLVLFSYSSSLRTLSQRERMFRTRMATHLATARRIQTRLSSTDANGACVEAVLNSDGRVLHAEGHAKSAGARSSLSDAVQLREWARHALQRRRRTDPLGGGILIHSGV